MKIEMSKFAFDKSHRFLFSVKFRELGRLSVGKMTHINTVIYYTTDYIAYHGPYSYRQTGSS